MDDQVNMLIGGRYRLERLLGEGGAARVWLARDELLERLVALKRLRSQYAQNVQFLERFRREAKLIAQLNSPHIVQIHDVGVRPEERFIAMEFVDGQDLKSLLKMEGSLPVRRALTLLRGIAAGVAVAHQAGLVHRDLKPANILMAKDGTVKVTDFGIARDVAGAGLTEPGTIWGTSFYMAPEQAQGKQPAPPMDVYALGVLLFEMLSGQVPYPGNDPMAVMMAHMQEPVPSLQQIAPSVPADVSQLVARMMAKAPEQRPPNAGVLVQILDRYLNASEAATVHHAPVASPDLPSPPAPLPRGEGSKRPSPPAPLPRGKGSQARDVLPSGEGPTRLTNAASADEKSQLPTRLIGGVVIVFLSLCLLVSLATVLSSEEWGIFGGSDPSPVPIGAAPTETLIPLPKTETPFPTETSLPPTEVPLPPTEVPLPPTEVPLPPTEAPLPPTETNPPPTAYPEPPTETSVPPSATPSPPPAIPTATEAAALPSPTPLIGREGNGPDGEALRVIDGGIRIDGDLSEWDRTRPVNLVHLYSANRRDGKDLSGTAFLAWDNTFLYLAIQRTDDEHIQTRTGHELYRDDSVELWLDSDLWGDFEVAENNEDDFQFAFSAGDFTTLKPEAVTYFPDRDPRKLEVGAEQRGTSYLLEAAIPWQALNVQPEIDLILGYAVVLNDNDSPQTKEPQTQLGSTLEAPYLRPLTFGNLRLAP